ncbi:MAG TPA: DUF4124 domain-containing protein [Gammaproteobacteria bacterium]|nr:DUF4124 domain-containing protein [Gammaproteobacteria bacterium]
MRKCLILLFALTAGAAHSAPAWRWVDANGQVHYSDTPVPGATQVELSGAQTFGTAQRPSQTGRTVGQAQTKATGPVQSYRSFNIVSPTQQETLWNVGTVVNVQVQLDPPLQPSHLLDIYVDGQRRNLNTTDTQLTLEDMYRGVHTIQAVVLDGTGAEVIRSLATTFMIQQSSIQNPNNPNSPNKPQPKARP